MLPANYALVAKLDEIDMFGKDRFVAETMRAKVKRPRTVERMRWNLVG